MDWTLIISIFLLSADDAEVTGISAICVPSRSQEIMTEAEQG